MSVAELPCVFDSDGLQIEGLRRDGDSDLAAVVMHPHPQYGGDMHNHVVEAICEALAVLNITTLRFNFRGTGRSGGAYEGGAGEAHDGLAAVATLRADAPDRPILLAGYSFGAMIAAAIAAPASPKAIVLVSPPLAYADLPLLPAQTPLLVLAGAADALVPASALAAIEGPGRRVVVAAGVDHSWWPGVNLVADELREFAAILMRGVSAP